VDASGLAFNEKLVTVKDFLARDYNTAYLVEDVLPAGQVCIAGGPEKGQKSNLLTDLAVSLAAGKPWLGRFPVPRQVKVLLLTGETQGKNLQNILHRILKAKDLTAKDIDGHLDIKEELPRLDNLEDLSTLRYILRGDQPEVVILDPLYFALGAIDPHLLSQVGATIARVARSCTEAGATPIFAHHMSKTAQMRRSEEKEPMQLADLNGAGFGPVAGSWLLVNYLQPYEPDTGTCTLWLNVGGRSGHGGLYTVAIEEGSFHKDLPLNGRIWQVKVQAGKLAVEVANQVRAQAKGVKEAVRAQEKEANKEILVKEIQEWLVSREPTGAIQAEVAARFEIKPQKAAALLAVMLERLLVVKARKLKSDNPKACRWRALGGTIPGGKLASLLRSGMAFEDALEECKGDQ